MDITIGSGESLDVYIRGDDTSNPIKHLVNISSEGTALFSFEHGVIKVENDTVISRVYPKHYAKEVPKVHCIDLSALKRIQDGS